MVQGEIEESGPSAVGQANDIFVRIRQFTTDALRYWELRRLFYNLILGVIVAYHFIARWPNSGSLLSFDTILGLFILAVLANAAYSVVGSYSWLASRLPASSRTSCRVGSSLRTTPTRRRHGDQSRDMKGSTQKGRLIRLPRDAMVAAVVALGCGLGIAWVDTRPTWDDAGVTAAALLATAGLAGLARVPFWLATVLVAGPVLVAELPRGYGVLLAIPFALVGALGGGFLRRRISPG